MASARRRLSRLPPARPRPGDPAFARRFRAPAAARPPGAGAASAEPGRREGRDPQPGRVDRPRHAANAVGRAELGRMTMDAATLEGAQRYNAVARTFHW